MLKVKAQPLGSTPIDFDVRRYGVRFQMEDFPQHPMDMDMAYTAMQIIYHVVLDSDLKEFTALVVCQGLALGRFRTWFLDSEGRKRKRGAWRPFRSIPRIAGDS